MAPLSRQELETLVVIMRAMHDSACDANWQELARLDNERRALLKFDPDNDLDNVDTHTPVVPNAVPNAIPATPQTSVADTLVEEIAALDRQIIDTVQSARAHLLAQNRELSAQVKAKDLYAKTSQMG